MSRETTALILGDLQNDFLHPNGAYGRAGQASAARGTYAASPSPADSAIPTSSPPSSISASMATGSRPSRASTAAS